MDWKPIETAPFDCDLELAVIDTTGTHALVFPCRRSLWGWRSAQTNDLTRVRPTHWREWQAGAGDRQLTTRSVTSST